MLYEKLEVWKRSRRLAIAVFRHTATCRDIGFKNQITRSVLSVPSNIAEGCERNSSRERVRFLYIAKGSLGEFKTQADIGVEIGYIPERVGLHWLDESEALSRMLFAVIRKLNAR